MQKVEEYQLEKLRQLIEISKTKEAIHQLKRIGKGISPDFYNTIILISSRLNRANKRYDMGLATDQQYAVQIVKIDNALLNLIDSIPNELQLKALIQSLNKEVGAPQPISLKVPDTAHLERVFDTEEIFGISWAEKALIASKSVCKVELSDGGSGTGFIVKGGYLLTNQHVIPTKEVAQNTRLIFNYQLNAEGNMQPTAEYRLDASVFYSSPENELDYTLVKIMDDPQNPLSEWGHLNLDNFSNPQENQRVNIIQHPNGDPMKIALPDRIIGTRAQYLYYIADTQEGSSGSPVFNQHWEVIALHHGGKSQNGTEGDYQINEAGDRQPANEGISIKKIIEDLQSENIIIH